MVRSASIALPLLLMVAGAACTSLEASGPSTTSDAGVPEDAFSPVLVPGADGGDDVTGGSIGPDASTQPGLAAGGGGPQQGVPGGAATAGGSAAGGSTGATPGGGTPGGGTAGGGLDGGPTTIDPCLGIPQCTACTNDSQCPEPGVCRSKHCNTQKGICEPGFAAPQTSCGGSTSKCDGAGQCVGCLSDNDCGDPGECKLRFCNLSTRVCEPKNAPSTTSCGTGGRHCDNGLCVQCSNASECAEHTCQSKSCSSGQCVYTNATVGAPCTGGVCTASQQCRECVTAAQCAKFDGACTEGMCSNNACVSRNKTGACGTLRVCASGSCINSCGNGALDTVAGEECEISVLGATDWSCTSACKLTGYQNSGLGKRCTSDADCGPNLTCDGTWYGTPFCYPRCVGSATSCTVPPGYTGLSCSGGAGPGGRSCLVQCRSNGTCPAGGVCSTSSATGLCITNVE